MERLVDASSYDTMLHDHWNAWETPYAGVDPGAGKGRGTNRLSW